MYTKKNRNVRDIKQPEPNFPLLSSKTSNKTRKRKYSNITRPFSSEEELISPEDSDFMIQDDPEQKNEPTFRDENVNDDDNNNTSEESIKDIYSIDPYENDGNNNENDNDDDDNNNFVYDTLNTDIYGNENNISVIDEQGTRRVFNKNGLIKNVYNREKKNNRGSSIWRRKILELISRQKSEVYQFALMLSNLIDENIDFVLNEFPKNYITPNVQVKNLLEDLLKKLPNSKSPQEWNQIQIIIRSILASIKQFTEEVYNEDDYKTKKHSSRNENSNNKRKLVEKESPLRGSPYSRSELESNDGNLINQEEEGKNGINDYDETIIDELEEYYKDQIKLIGESDYNKSVNQLVTRIVNDFNTIYSNISNFIKQQQRDKYIYIGIEMYEKITLTILLILDYVSKCFVILHNVSEDESKKIYKYMESYIDLQKTFSNDKMIPLTFMDIILEILKTITSIVSKIPDGNQTNYSQYYKLIQKTLSEFKTKFTKNKLVELVHKFNFQQAERNYSLEMNLQKKSDVSELLEVLNQIDNSGQLDKKFISPWADNDSTLAIVFFSDNIYGLMLIALNNINIFSNNNFKMMELINTPKVSAVFAKYVSHLFTSTKLNKRQKLSNSKQSIIYDSTRFQLIENHNITRDVSLFFKHVKRVHFKDEETGKIIGSQLIIAPQSTSLIKRIL